MDPLTLATSITTLLSPLLLKFGEQAAESLGEKLPEGVGKLWNAITAKFKGKPAAEEAVKELAAKPADEDNVTAFRIQLKKALEAEPTFAQALEALLKTAQSQTGVSISNTGSGAVAANNSVAAGEGGVAVQGDAHGDIIIGGTKPPKG